MRTRTIRLGLVTSLASGIFYAWLAIFLSSGSVAHLPLWIQLNGLNEWLGNVEWLFLYGWIVGLFYVTVGDKIGKSHRSRLRLL